MCLAIPGRIVEFIHETHHLATVEVSGVRRAVNVALVLSDGLEVGDWILVHVGFAMSKIDEEEAERTTRYLKALGGMYNDELNEIVESQIE